MSIAERARALGVLEGPPPDLARALDAHQLVLAYQPVVELAGDAVWGFEALARWRHPDGGLVPASALLGPSVRGHTAERLDRWVVGEACRQMSRWAREHPPAEWARVAVNVAPVAVADGGFPAAVGAALEASGIPGARLCLEIHGDEPVPAPSRLAGAMAELRSMGVRVVIDECGAGYPALADLPRLPVDGLKVGRALVAGLDSLASSLALVEAVAAMADALGVSLLAAGVETDTQRRALEQVGCECAQGHLFARPMDPSAAGPWVAARPQAAPPAVRPRACAAEGAGVTLTEAAGALGVSSSTLRRWADSGRIAAVRTAGGHRRFPTSEVRRLARGEAARRPVRGVAPPEEPLGALADVMEDRGDELLRVAVRSIYQRRGDGWFASEAGDRRLRAWARVLQTAARQGAYHAALDDTRTLLRRAGIGGASLLECTLLVERFGMALQQALRQAGTAAPQAGVPRLFTALRHELLREKS